MLPRTTAPLRSFACCIALLSFTFMLHAHTLPVSYLRLVPEADYLHLELVFNPFELTFIAEVDENKDGELETAELQEHGPTIAARVLDALYLTVNGREIQPETSGMDPDLNGHHVRLRAHYKIDARQVPLTLKSELAALTSASHLTQVTCAHAEGAQLAQLDSRSQQATFTPPGAPGKILAEANPAPRRRIPIVLIFMLVIGPALVWRLVRRRPAQ